MFVCDGCHQDHPNALMCGLMRSHGRCEGCGKTTACNDCHYVSPETKAKVAQLLRDAEVPDER